MRVKLKRDERTVRVKRVSVKATTSMAVKDVGDEIFW